MFGHQTVPALGQTPPPPEPQIQRARTPAYAGLARAGGRASCSPLTWASRPAPCLAARQRSAGRPYIAPRYPWSGGRAANFFRGGVHASAIPGYMGARWAASGRALVRLEGAHGSRCQCRGRQDARPPAR